MTKIETLRSRSITARSSVQVEQEPTALPVDELAAVAAQLQQLDDRREELQLRRASLAAAMDAKRLELGRAAAAGSGDEAVATLRASIRELEEQDQNAELGIDALDRRLGVVRRQHKALELDHAETALREATTSLNAAVGAIQDRMRRFAREELSALVDAMNARKATAGQAWVRAETLRRQAGMAPANPLSSPMSEAGWAAHPGLRAIVDQIAKYGTGRTVEQATAAFAQSSADSFRNAMANQNRE